MALNGISENAPGALNESHRRHILTNIQYADKLLSEIEQILVSASSKSPFPRYRVDVTPAQSKVVRDYIARIRAQMLRALEAQHITVPGPQFGAIHAIRNNLSFAQIAITEIGARYMAGYGEVPESAVAGLDGLVTELNALIEKLNAYLAQGLGRDLATRLEKLEWAGDEAGLLRRLERVISAHGLVEFRPKLGMILERLETRTFEIAVFGRVSSGKSSLLNHILEENVLPVGVNPITAVPTRLVAAPEPHLTVTFAHRRAERMDISALADFVTEQRNPSNSKGVTRIIVGLPSRRLKEGITFVDTPGLGSLATSGAMETQAYLPHCDLGVVLINAGSTLAEEDLATIRALYEAGVPASVLLSKADLLNAQDRESAVAYIAEQIRIHLGLALRVFPVSTVGDCSALLDTWFTEEIEPLYQRYRELADESVRRKLAALRESVQAALASKLAGADGVRPADQEALRQIEAELRKAAARIPEETSACLRATDTVEDLAPAALHKAAARVVELWRQGRDAGAGVVSAALLDTGAAAANRLYTRIERLAKELTAALQQAARALEAAEIPGDEELVLAVREMPQLDCGEISVPLERSPFVSIARPIVQRRLERRLEDAIGAQVTEAFRSYRRLLEAWLRRAINRMQAQFESHADTYRAQLDRLLASQEASPEAVEAIRRDLAELAAEPAGAGVAGNRAG